MQQNKPTIEEILKYEEFLIEAVLKQSKIEQDPKAKAVLLNLQVLLKSRAIKTFIDYLLIKRFSITAFKKVKEIDEALCELRVLKMNLPYPEHYFMIEQGKKELSQQYTMLALLFGLFGFEWID